MNIYIDHDGRTVGPFTLEEIDKKLAQGELTLSTMAIVTGSADWVPLSQIVRGGMSSGSPGGPELRDTQASSEWDATESDRAGEFSDGFYMYHTKFFKRATMVLIAPLEEALANPTIRVVYSRETIDVGSALEAFMKRAHAFNDSGSSTIARFVRSVTTLDAVKSSTSKSLMQDVKKEVFEDLATISESYFKVDRYGHTSTNGVFERYLVAFVSLPDLLVDYSFSKCFGAEVNMEDQEACIQTCKRLCREFSARANEIRDELLQKRVKWEQELINKEREQGMAAKSGCSGVLILIGIMTATLTGFIACLMQRTLD